MFSTLLQGDRSDRGQVGIGTLIVFIAMVLVAAIAAGVLINTAGLLQSQAEATGEETTDQVSNNIDIVSAQGEDTGGTADEIDEVTLVVKKSAGSDAIDVSDLELQLLNPDKGSEVTTVGELATGSSAITDSDDEILEQTGDRIEIVLDLSNDGDFNDEDMQIEEGSSAELIVTTASGAQTFKTLTVSSPIDSPENL